MEQTENERPAVDEGAQPRKRPSKREKPDFNGFLEAVKLAVEGGDSKKMVPALVKVLKTGFKSTLAPAHIDAIFSVLKDRPECSRIALHLSALARKPPCPNLIRLLANRLVSHFRGTTEYPKAADETTDPLQSAAILNEWVDRAIAQPRQDTGAGRQVPFDIDRFRSAMLVLMDEPVAARTGAVYKILDICCGPSKPNLPIEPEYRFLREIEMLVATGTLNAKRVSNGLGLSTIARMFYDHACERLGSSESTINAQKSRIEELEKAVAALNDSLSNATEKLSELERSLQERSHEVERQKEERHLDEEHWKILSEQRLTKQANEVSGRLTHEIKEARMCLADESPNIQMALDRLTRMEKWLEKWAQ